MWMCQVLDYKVGKDLERDVDPAGLQLSVSEMCYISRGVCTATFTLYNVGAGTQSFMTVRQPLYQVSCLLKIPMISE